MAENNTVDYRIIVQLFVYIISIVNTVCTMLGFPLLNLGEESITEVVNVVVTVVTWVAGIWFNFNATKSAKEAQSYLDSLKKSR